MTRDEFIRLLEENIKPDAKMEFLIADHTRPMIAFLDVHDVCMNADVDDPNNYNCGGVVFKIQKDLMK